MNDCPFDEDENVGALDTCKLINKELVRNIPVITTTCEQLEETRALVREQKELLNAVVGALEWCSGSKDFRGDGIARLGWDKDVVPVLNRVQQHYAKLDALRNRMSKE